MIEIKLGEKDWRTDSPRGRVCINPAGWMREKGSLRDFRKILKLCAESDRGHGTTTIAEWNEFLSGEPARIREKAREVTRDYNNRCDTTRRYYDDPGLPLEAKREKLKEMNKDLRELKQAYDRVMKRLGKDLETVKKLRKEMSAVC